MLTPGDGGSRKFPVKYQAAEGARPIFDGGRQIRGFRRGEDGLWHVSLPEAAETLYGTKYGALPVVSGGRLVGILTAYDLVRALVDILRGTQSDGEA